MSSMLSLSLLFSFNFLLKIISKTVSPPNILKLFVNFAKEFFFFFFFAPSLLLRHGRLVSSSVCGGWRGLQWGRKRRGRWRKRKARLGSFVKRAKRKNLFKIFYHKCILVIFQKNLHKSPAVKAGNYLIDILLKNSRYCFKYPIFTVIF